MINENISFESCFSFKKILESDIQKTSKNRDVCKYQSTKVLKDSSGICNSAHEAIWNYEILGYFHKKLKLADVTSVYKINKIPL